MSRTCNCSRMTELAVAKLQLVNDLCDPCVANHHLLHHCALKIIMNRRFIQPRRVRELGWDVVGYQCHTKPAVCLVH